MNRIYLSLLLLVTSSVGAMEQAENKQVSIGLGPVIYGNVFRISPDEKQLLVAANGYDTCNLSLYKMATSEKIANIGKDGTSIVDHTLSWSPKGSYIACQRAPEKGYPVEIWDAQSHRLLHSIDGQSVAGFTFTSDEKKILIKSDFQPLKVYDVVTGSLISAIGKETYAQEFSLSTDDRFVAVEGAEPNSEIHSLDSGKLVRTVKGRKWPQLSRDGKFIVTLNRFFNGNNQEDEVIITNLETGTSKTIGFKKLITGIRMAQDSSCCCVIEHDAKKKVIGFEKEDALCTFKENAHEDSLINKFKDTYSSLAGTSNYTITSSGSYAIASSRRHLHIVAVSTK